MVTGHTRDSRFHWRRLSARGLILTSAAVMLAAAGSAYSHLEKGIPHAHGTDADASTRASDGPELVFSELVPGWLFSHPAELDISQDGRFASLGSGVWFALVDLGSGAALERSDGPRKISAAAFRGKRDLAFFNGKAWFSGRIADASRSTALDLPAPIAARWCANGEQVAYFVSLPYFVENETSGSLWVGNARGVSTKLAVDGRVTAVEWFPKCDALLVLTHDAGTGLSRLSKVDPLSGKAQLLRGELDAAGLTGSVGISADARTAYLSLAGATPPEDRVRHEPHARNRDLDIYALDLASGKLERLVASPYDDFAPVVRGNTLYWTRNHLKTDAVVLPIEGGEPHIVLEGGQLPYWNTEGNMIAATIGQNRIADVVLNLDIDVVTLDANKRPVGPPREILRGSHEDFTAAWSPDGRWMAIGRRKWDPPNGHRTAAGCCSPPGTGMKSPTSPTCGLQRSTRRPARPRISRRSACPVRW
jgi:hypothetical protein